MSKQSKEVVRGNDCEHSTGQMLPRFSQITEIAFYDKPGSRPNVSYSRTSLGYLDRRVHEMAKLLLDQEMLKVEPALFLAD